MRHLLSTEVQVKRETGKDMYGKPTYTTFAIPARIEETLEKVASSRGEEYFTLYTIYTTQELKLGDLIGVDGENFYPVFDVDAIRDSRGKIVYYKAYSLRGTYR